LFHIHRINLVVERLSFHVPGEQTIYFKDDNQIDDIMAKPTILESMFTCWMECNKKYQEARQLTYVDLFGCLQVLVKYFI